MEETMAEQKQGVMACNCNCKCGNGETEPKRKRGRPRKIKDPSVVVETNTPRFRRGRPRLNDLKHLPSFFKFYLPKWHSNQLVIPREFIKNINGKITKNGVLRNLKGKNWNVELEKKGNKLLVKKGWEEFVNDNSLTGGELLIFHYNEKTKFTVEIFSMNGCQKQIPTVFNESSEEVTRDVPEETSQFRLMNNIRFRKVYKGHDLYNLHIPTEIFKMYKVKPPKMNHSEIIVLRKVRGESQEVKMSHRANSISLNKGWRDFQVNNNIHKGDECEFEVIVDEGRRIKEIILLKVRPPRLY